MDFALVCRAVIIIVFLVSTISKVRDFPSFVSAVKNFEIVPESMTHAAAFIVIGAEVSIVLMLVAGGAWLYFGFLLATFLLTVFFFTLATTLHKRLRVSCNCFGDSKIPVSYLDLLRNLVLIACSLASLGFTQYPTSIFQQTDILALLITGCVSSSLTILLINLHEIVWLFLE